MVSGHIADFSLDYEVGNSVFIDNRDWVIAEVRTGFIILQRDSVDGTSQTIDVSKNELQELVKETQHKFEN